MQVLQVKKYNDTIAQKKWDRCDKTKCVPSMFFFYLYNDYVIRYGLNIPRKRGYVAFDNKGAVFGMNEQEAIKEFNKYK